METGTPALIRIERGVPDDAELAATLIALLTVLARGSGETDDDPSPGWTPVRGYRPPGAWTSA
jgi:Acyl-CoA carboxylase epsilon subunit